MLEAPSEQLQRSAGSIDSQNAKTGERSGSRGYDGGKKITGRKRNIAVDTLGLLHSWRIEVQADSCLEHSR